MADYIYLEGLEFYAYHGVFPEENKLGQRFRVDLKLCVDLHAAGISDNVQDTVHYGEVYDTVEQIVTGQPYQLLERLATAIAEAIFAKQGHVQALTVRVIKPDPPIPGHYKQVAVEITRTREALS